MMKFAVLGLAILLAVGAAAQAPQGGGARFDVVSIKPAPDVHSGAWADHLENGRWTVRGAIPVSALLTLAFGLRPGEIESLPDWARTTMLAIDARAEGDYTQAQFREMVRNMLVDRFHLAWHTETRPTDVYVLSVAKGGSKPQPASAACVNLPPDQPVPDGQVRCGISVKREALVNRPPADGDMPMKLTVSGYSVSMADLADYIPIRLATNLPVVDQTGLTGRYDMTLSYNMTAHITGLSPTPAGTSPAPVPPDPVPQVSFADVMKAAWGLELTQKKLPRPVVVVDHLEMPTAN